MNRSRGATVASGAPASRALDASTVYGLDIETDTTVDGLDPRVAHVVAVALAGPTSTQVFTASDLTGEARLLARLDAAITRLAPGVLVTWNGAAFDLPFLADRARHHTVTLSLDLHLALGLPSRSDPLAGHEGAYRACWGAHRHLDVYRVYRADVGARLGLPCGLKAMARLVGCTPIEVDRSRVHELTDAERDAYVASDAELTRLLCLRRWPAIGRAVDPRPASMPAHPPGAQRPSA